MTKELSPLRRADRRKGALEEREAIVRWLLDIDEEGLSSATPTTLANWVRAGMHDRKIHK